MKPTALIYKHGSHLTFVVKNKTHSITAQDSFFDQAVEAYKKGNWAALVSLTDRPQYIARYSEGRIVVTDDAVLFNGKELANYATTKLLEFMELGLPVGPIVRFLDDLQNAKAEHVKEDLYRFLEKNDLPLTDDGGFLAYKLVNDDGSPHYVSGTSLKYKVGETHEMPYDSCDTSRDECGRQGFHAGNRSYWNGSFDARGDYTGEGRMLMVKLMPSWVVSVPDSAGGSKLRAFKMEIVSEYNKAARKQTDHVSRDEEETHPIESNDPELFEMEPRVYRQDPKAFDTLQRQARASEPKRDGFGRFIGKPKRDARGHFIKAKAVKPKMPKRGPGGRFLKRGGKA